MQKMVAVCASWWILWEYLWNTLDTAGVPARYCGYFESTCEILWILREYLRGHMHTIRQHISQRLAKDRNIILLIYIYILLISLLTFYYLVRIVIESEYNFILQWKQKCYCEYTSMVAAPKDQQWTQIQRFFYKLVRCRRQWITAFAGYALS